jgi:hypothetical protein
MFYRHFVGKMYANYKFVGKKCHFKRKVREVKCKYGKCRNLHTIKEFDAKMMHQAMNQRKRGVYHLSDNLL